MTIAPTTAPAPPVASTAPAEPAVHAAAWLVWAIGASAAVQLAPNPVYVGLVIGAAWVVVGAHRRPGGPGRAFEWLLAVGLVFSLVRIGLAVLTVHGNGDVWFTLPQATLPRLLGGFTVGGPIEGSVLWQVAAEALSVLGVLAAFGAFNAVAAHHELLERMPRAFHAPGLVLAVAITAVPATLEAGAAAREADLARTGGRLVRRGRLIRRVVPVLETGLERAVHLSESMDARGFGRQAPTAAERTSAGLGVVSLVALVGALGALVGGANGVAAGAGLVGVASLVAAVAVAATSPLARAGLRRRPIRGWDQVVMAVAVAVPAALGLCALVGDDTLRWTVGLPVQPPSISLAPLLLVLLLALPALIPPTPPATGPGGAHR